MVVLILLHQKIDQRKSQISSQTFFPMKKINKKEKSFSQKNRITNNMNGLKDKGNDNLTSIQIIQISPQKSKPIILA